MSIRSYLSRFAGALMVTTMFTSVASAGFVTSFGVANNFVEPTHWTVGDAGSTYQAWNAKTTGTGSIPDVGTTVSPGAPTHSVVSPGFGPTSSQNFYSFGGTFGANADIANWGTTGVGLGTHVVVQTGTTINTTLSQADGHPEFAAGHGWGVFWDTMELVDLNGNSLTGGDNLSALQIAEVSYANGLSSPFGPVNYQELIFEFWLPNYTGDFRVQWGEMVHTTIDTLRVDSLIVAADPSGSSPFDSNVNAVPEPSSAVLLLLGTAGMGLFARKRRQRSLTAEASTGNKTCC